MSKLQVFLLTCRFLQENKDLFDIQILYNLFEPRFISFMTLLRNKYFYQFLHYAWLEILLADLLDGRSKMERYFAHCSN